MDEIIPSILESDGSTKLFRQNRARLIQKIYEVDPLTCPKCSGPMKVISVIENENVIKKILKHLGLWDCKARPPPKVKTGSETIIDYSQSQLPQSDDYLYYDEEFPAEYPDFRGEALSSWFLKRKMVANGIVCRNFMGFQYIPQYNLNSF